jgi:nucleotide-binding universal stress UspA family protein
MKTLLLPFYDDEISQHTFEVAARVVRRVEGYLEGIFVMRRPQVLDGESDMLSESHFTQFEEERRRIAESARARFAAAAATHGLSIEPVGAARGAAVGWREIEAMDEQIIGSHGRLFDLIAIGRGFGQPWLNWRSVLESALFESGRPVLLTPETSAAQVIGDNVVIAWNCSTETARTVALSMPLLTRAASVTVLTVEGWGVPGPRAQDLAAYLVRAGVPATARHIERGGRAPAESILAECTRSGADLLIKGAYTQSRLRQLIFGGATRHVLAQAKLPVILAH